MQVCVIGLGYIGLPTSALLAQAGHDVTGVDINPEIVNTINAGKVHLEEPGLPPLVAEQVNAGKLQANSQPRPADVFIIAVPTPFIEEDKAPDMSIVRAATESICQYLKEGDLVILQSTSPVGSTESDVAEVIFAKRPELRDHIDFAYSPERAIPGKTMQEMVENDRAIGGLTDQATQRTIEFYQSFVTGEIIATSAPVAELVKLVENASRDAQIAFANELDAVCEHLGLDVWEVIKLANHHPRVNILQPGPGVGGHCLAVDPWFIVNRAPAQTKLIKAAREINDDKPHAVIRRIQAALNGANNPTIAVLGLAYKPDVDDFRESPSVTVTDHLIDANLGEVLVVEPYMKSSDKYALTEMKAAVSKADVIVVLTHHTVFKEQLTLGDFAGKTLIDTRGQFNPHNG